MTDTQHPLLWPLQFTNGTDQESRLYPSNNEMARSFRARTWHENLTFESLMRYLSGSLFFSFSKTTCTGTGRGVPTAIDLRQLVDHTSSQTDLFASFSWVDNCRLRESTAHADWDASDVHWFFSRTQLNSWTRFILVTRTETRMAWHSICKFSRSSFTVLLDWTREGLRSFHEPTFRGNFFFFSYYILVSRRE